jgi:hypothetical protein
MRAAQERMAQMLSGQARAVPSLEQAMTARRPQYERLLSRDTDEFIRTQMLMDLAQRGFGFAANVDEQGRPLRGSFASRLSGALRTTPASMAALGAQRRKEQQAIELAALQAAEKDVEGARGAASREGTTRDRLLMDVLKADARAAADAEKAAGASIFGKGDWQWKVINAPGLLEAWSQRQTTPEQDALVDSALTVLKTPRVETRTDPVTNQPYTVQTPALIPDFVKRAEAARARAARPAETAPVRTGQDPARPADAQPTATRSAGEVPAEQAGAAVPGAAPPARTYNPTDATMFNLAGKGTGPVAITASFLSRIPLLGGIVEAGEETQARTFLSNAVNQLNRAIATNPRFAEGERQQIQAELDLTPRLIEREEAYINRLIGLDSLLMEIRKKTFDMAYGPELGPEDKRNAREKLRDIDGIRELIGIPRVGEVEVRSLPSGARFVMPDGTIRVKK